MTLVEYLAIQISVLVVVGLAGYILILLHMDREVMLDQICRASAQQRSTERADQSWACCPTAEWRIVPMPPGTYGRPRQRRRAIDPRPVRTFYDNLARAA